MVHRRRLKPGRSRGCRGNLLRTRRQNGRTDRRGRQCSLHTTQCEATSTRRQLVAVHTATRGSRSLTRTSARRLQMALSERAVLTCSRLRARRWLEPSTTPIARRPMGPPEGFARTLRGDVPVSPPQHLTIGRHPPASSTTSTFISDMPWAAVHPRVHRNWRRFCPPAASRR